MHICYVSSFCDPKEFDNALSGGQEVNYAIQKFNRLLLEGLIANEATVSAISSPDVILSRDSKKKRCSDSKFHIKYTTDLGRGMLRLCSKCLSAFFYVLFEPKNTVVLMDVLKISGGVGALLAAKIRGFYTCGIVTDLPEYQEVCNNRRMCAINNWLIDRQKSYVLLTEAMNEKINPTGKPYVIVEGFADSAMHNVQNPSMDYEEKKVMYAGSLQKKYGIEQLAQAFIKVRQENEVLEIFGAGDYEDELVELARQYTFVRFQGKKSNVEVLEAEQQAYLLVNPRTAEGEYTKYSFPSKTLEYMASGVPVLMHKLPGIPEEYDEYLFYFSGATDEAIATSLRQVLDTNMDVITQRGLDAKKFVVSTKNEKQQAKRILCFLEREN